MKVLTENQSTFRGVLGMSAPAGGNNQWNSYDYISSVNSAGEENQRVQVMTCKGTIRSTRIYLSVGANDFDVVITWKKNLVDTDKTLTIPSDAGVADYTENTPITFDEGDLIGISFTTSSPSSGNASIRGINSEVFLHS